jgi:hypothetical protein
MAFSLNPLDWFKPQVAARPQADQAPPEHGYLFDNQSGNTLAPGSFSVAAGDPGSYAYMPNGQGGLNYFSGNAPISNTQYGQATGQDYGALEAAAKAAYQNGGRALDTSTYNSNTDPSLVGQAQGMIGNDQNTLNNLYSAINGALTGYAQDARGNVDKQYNNLQQQQDNTYRTNIAGSDAAFGARNAFDSSYRGNADQSMTNAYNQANQSLGDQKNQAYAGIGSTIQGVQDQLANKPQYDLSQYKDVNALTSLHNQLGQYISSLQGTQRSLTPQGALVQKLNSVAPLTSNLDSTLKGQLSSIVNANTPTEAQQPLAMAYLQRAGVTDPTQQKAYLDYLKQITRTNSFAGA